VQATAATLCLQLLMPGVINPATAATDQASAAAVLASSIATYPRVAEEPPLACYVFAPGCQGASSAGGVAGARKLCRKQKRGAHHKGKPCKKHGKKQGKKQAQQGAAKSSTFQIVPWLLTTPTPTRR
jgi:hypothetical protein